MIKLVIFTTYAGFILMWHKLILFWILKFDTTFSKYYYYLKNLFLQHSIFFISLKWNKLKLENQPAVSYWNFFKLKFLF